MLLYNRRASSFEDVNSRIHFVSCNNHRYKWFEELFERGVRNYLKGFGVPQLARWADLGGVGKVDLTVSTGRATQVLLTMTGSDLMPATDGWSLKVWLTHACCLSLTKLQFVFRYSDSNGLDGFSTETVGISNHRG